MKKRRTLIISLLLAAALCLGVGYAGVATILSINGTAKSDVVDIDVVFKSADGEGNPACKIVDGTNTTIKEASSVSAGGNIDINFYAYGLKNQGDFVTAEFVVVNNNDYVVTLTDPTLKTEMDAFSYELLDWSTSERTLQPDGEATFRIKITLDSPLADEIVETFTVNINAHSGTQTTTAGGQG